MSEGVVLEARNVTRKFGDLTVLEDVSLELETGTLTALIGPNGSGKTTLLRVLTGVLPPTEGSVVYDCPDANRTVGYVQQQPSFRPGFTVRETLEFYAALVGAEPEPLLERVGLSDAMNRRVETLSGGMTRLLGIAQATVGDPPVVVMDEPASGLDPGMRNRTYEIAQDLADEAAVLVSSHDLALVEEFADRVIVLDSGQVVADGHPEGLRDDQDGGSLWDVFDSIVDGPRGEVEVPEVSR